MTRAAGSTNAVQMIAHLKGILTASGADHAVIDVNGVGYLVGASARALAQLPPPGWRHLDRDRDAGR